MDKMLIRGGKPLNGKIYISGAKNAALPLMAACLLTDEPLVLSNVPRLADIETMCRLLEQHGVEIKQGWEPRELPLFSSREPVSGSDGNMMTLRAFSISSTTAPYDIVRKMRASILVLGPLVARYGNARVSLPGGCAIGTRPVDFHINALRAMGAEISIENGYIQAHAPNRLCGTEIAFPVVSVTGTENVMMAACLAKGETTIINAAREPEVTDLANCLVSMGAEIDGIGTSELRIVGKERLKGANHTIIPDRIETGTFAIAAAITNGCVELIGARIENLPTVTRVLSDAGISVEKNSDGNLVVKRRNEVLHGIDVTTEPFPGFPTDLQAQIMALMCFADRASLITETIWENRFMHVPELMRMGADIVVHNASAMVRRVPKLKGAPVMATDLRASVSLVLAGLAAEGETIVNRLYHLDRGYERLEEKLRACGADIERIK